mmetsp:Transcript_24245/g.45815  ORF Transcript_24245/g.45815 Transcript_24245/m.45815 type:complete len:84 (+) Transcript_24245:38-289(+)
MAGNADFRVLAELGLDLPRFTSGFRHQVTIEPGPGMRQRLAAQAQANDAAGTTPEAGRAPTGAADAAETRTAERAAAGQGSGH